MVSGYNSTMPSNRGNLCRASLDPRRIALSNDVTTAAGKEGREGQSSEDGSSVNNNWERNWFIIIIIIKFIFKLSGLFQGVHLSTLYRYLKINIHVRAC